MACHADDWGPGLAVDPGGGKSGRAAGDCKHGLDSGSGAAASGSPGAGAQQGTAPPESPLPSSRRVARSQSWKCVGNTTAAARERAGRAYVTGVRHYGGAGPEPDSACPTWCNLIVFGIQFKKIFFNIKK